MELFNSRSTWIENLVSFGITWRILFAFVSVDLICIMRLSREHWDIKFGENSMTSPNHYGSPVGVLRNGHRRRAFSLGLRY